MIQYIIFDILVILIILATYNVIFCYSNKWYDVILIWFNNGNKITARYIQSQLWLLVFIFLTRMVFRVCIDPTHQKFSLILELKDQKYYLLFQLILKIIWKMVILIVIIMI